MSLRESPVAGIYPILDAQWLEQSGRCKAWTPEARTNVAKDIYAANISILQLRCKQSGQAAYEFIDSWISTLRKQCPDTAVIINDRVDLALYFEADGVHVGQDDLPIHLCRQLLGTKGIIGLSTHSPSEIQQAAETTADYIGFGPIFATSSKSDTHAVQGVDALQEARRSSPLPMVAIGGIGLTQLPDVHATQVASAAMISGVWDQNGMPQFQTAARYWD
jgi:thiamine-phosphate pyrophosphorylase